MLRICVCVTIALATILTTRTAATGEHVGPPRYLLQSPEKLENTLFAAVLSGNVKKVRSLISKGVDIDAKSEGYKPIDVAVINGDLKMVQYLLKRGANVNATDSSQPPLKLAAVYGFPEVARALLENGSDVNETGGTVTPLYTAAGYGYEDVIKVLVEFGAGLEIPCEAGATPLYTAAFYGKFEAVKALIKAGANTNAHQNQGFTPLFVASDLKTTKLLVKHGADVNAQSCTSKDADPCEEWQVDLTPLMLAARENQPWKVAFLLENGAKIRMKNGEGKSALDMASQSEDAEIIGILGLVESD